MTRQLGRYASLQPQGSGSRYYAVLAQLDLSLPVCHCGGLACLFGVKQTTAQPVTGQCGDDGGGGGGGLGSGDQQLTQGSASGCLHRNPTKRSRKSTRIQSSFPFSAPSSLLSTVSGQAGGDGDGLSHLALARTGILTLGLPDHHEAGQVPLLHADTRR